MAARRSLRDRFFTPPVARAITSPLGILLAGAGAAVGIVAGLPIVAAAGLGAAAWAARVAAAIPRGAIGERIDPFALGEPWRRFVQEALQTRARFDEAVSHADRGPLRDRLQEIADRMETGVQACWRIARRGQALVDARKGIDVDAARVELDRIERDASQPWAAGSALDRTAQALRSQLATAERMDHVIQDAYARLQLLDARMDEAIARTLELSVQADTDADLRGLGSDVDTLVDDMEALRQALEEASDAEQTGFGSRAAGEGGSKETGTA
jgi:hypothetical protein